MNDNAKLGCLLFAVICVVIFISLCMWLYPKYKIYSKEMDGRAELAQQEFSKQVAVEEAKAKLESAKLLSQAEVERAKGVAEANTIIGDSLKDNEAYLRYLWIQGLHDGSSEVIYVPTEAGLPILEAGKR